VLRRKGRCSHSSHRSTAGISGRKNRSNDLTLLYRRDSGATSRLDDGQTRLILLNSIAPPRRSRAGCDTRSISIVLLTGYLAALAPDTLTFSGGRPPRDRDPASHSAASTITVGIPAILLPARPGRQGLTKGGGGRVIQVGLRVRDLLTQTGVHVVMTRVTPEEVDLGLRRLISRAAQRSRFRIDPHQCFPRLSESSCQQRVPDVYSGHIRCRYGGLKPALLAGKWDSPRQTGQIPEP